MKENSNPKKTRIVAGTAMLFAAFGAFSLNQGGLTGRATGGAVGCGAVEEVEASSVSARTQAPSFEVGVVGDVVQVSVRAVERLNSPTILDDSLRRAFPKADVRPANLEERLTLDGHTLFLDLVRQADMLDIFRDGSLGVTLFAPTNEAIRASEDLAYFTGPSNKALLQSLVRHHLVSGRFYLDAPPSNRVATNLDGQSLRLDPEAFEVVSENGVKADVVVANSETDLGMVHAVSQVLLPKVTTPMVMMREKYHLFWAMLDVAGMVDALSDPDQQHSVLAVSDAKIQSTGWDLQALQDPANEEWVKHVVANHVIEGDVVDFTAQPQRAMSGLTLDGVAPGKLRLPDGTEAGLSGASPAQNGTVHDCDTLIELAP